MAAVGSNKCLLKDSGALILIWLPPFYSVAALGDDRKKRPRTAFSAAQIKALETEFERGKYLSVAKRTALAKQLQLTETQVRIASHWHRFLSWILYFLAIFIP